MADDSEIPPPPTTASPLVTTRIPTERGDFQTTLYETPDGKEHLSLVSGRVENLENVWVRIHSECLTGDVFGSLRCDCGEQLNKAMNLIYARECGVIVYLRQEGRGIGLGEKLKAYNLQYQGYDTVEANLKLGHQGDTREYGAAAAILRSLKIRSVRLLTNNPAKIEGLRSHGVKVAGRIELPPSANPENRAYLIAKAKRMGHLFEPPATEE